MKLPGGTAGSTPVTAEAKGFSATKNIVLKFDNSLITTSDVDAAGKNKQIMGKVTFTYTKATGIATVESQLSAPNHKTAIYDINGRRITAPQKGIYIVGDKKIRY